MRKGFTLIELLVTIAIIGILAATILVAINAAKKSSKDVKVKADLAQIKRSVEAYKADTGSYIDKSCNWGTTPKCVEVDSVWTPSYPEIGNSFGKLSKDIANNASTDRFWFVGTTAQWTYIAPVPSKWTGNVNTSPFFCVSSAGLTRICDNYMSTSTLLCPDTYNFPATDHTTKYCKTL